jgi:hypothetical protein
MTNILSNLARQFLVLLSFYFPNNIKPFLKKEKKYKKILEKVLQKYKITKRNLTRTHIQFNEKIRNILLEKKLYNFLRNDFIQKMFFVHNRLFIYYELIELKKNLCFWKNYKKLLSENSFGNPIRYFLYPSSSGNVINHVFHLSLLCKFFDIPLKKIDFVFEFGGGYGCNANIFYKLNKKVKYIIYDTFLVNLLQFYYLNTINVKTLLNNIHIPKKVSLISELTLLKKINFTKYQQKLFVANWSLSETPLHFRKNFYKIICNVDYVLISFQEKFENINNLKYFNILKKKLSYKFDIKIVLNKHYIGNFFSRQNHYYFICKKIIINRQLI